MSVANPVRGAALTLSLGPVSGPVARGWTGTCFFPLGVKPSLSLALSFCSLRVSLDTRSTTFLSPLHLYFWRPELSQVKGSHCLQCLLPAFPHSSSSNKLLLDPVCHPSAAPNFLNPCSGASESLLSSG